MCNSFTLLYVSFTLLFDTFEADSTKLIKSFLLGLFLTNIFLIISLNAFNF